MRALVFLLLLVPTGVYAAYFPLEMCNDSRYRVEAWFRRNVPDDASVGAFIAGRSAGVRPQYLPRFLEMGLGTYAVPMEASSFDRPQPEYLVLSSYDYLDFPPESLAVMSRLLAGEFGYRAVHHAGPVYNGFTWPASGCPLPGKISPDITILRRGGDNSAERESE